MRCGIPITNVNNFFIANLDNGKVIHLVIRPVDAPHNPMNGMNYITLKLHMIYIIWGVKKIIIYIIYYIAL